MRALFALLLLLPLAACDDAAVAVAPPPPAELTADAAGYFCQMTVLDHPGPKGQAHLQGHAAPLWFPQVRDLVAFVKSGERSADVAALYVNDMAQAESWERPGPGTWIAAEDAYYVVGADIAGGMGAGEIVPFGTADAARAFAGELGGAVLRLADIPADAALGAVTPVADGRN
ncbi:nitrous oxide reductase accessory protein NosL [Futiania mangrovi]|uniref:Nitrous oxide reductase accessory protein NosL n=1 Tax=Futiania mangrovi TaxID=2959716 RepID=A0A9J6PJ50_9PROT|nr:nitrous oxide reductase accessory protein NosL [Futiania mangrovii]MCP1337840.1 nitrous oxide reductase accessory protein NosL [Futiania mangrovii]